MKFPLFWTRVYNPTKTVVARGWSEVSLDDATQHAQARLERILAWLRSDQDVDLDRYGYVVDDVICEEVIDRITHEGQEIAVVSRNAYGALILNAAKMMFVDIDFPRLARAGCLLGWFAKPKPPERTPEQETLDRVRCWQAEHSDITLRVYRTAAGIRLIVANQSFESVDDRALAMLHSLGSDALYIQLCRSQSCFRARLTPKPWRVGLGKPPKMFPFDKQTDKASFEAWYVGYVEKTKPFKVCALVETIGPAAIHPDHSELIEMHDNLCCNAQDLPLA